MNNIERERRFYAERSQKVVANPFGCADSFSSPAPAQVEEEKQACGMMVKRYVYDPKLKCKVKKEVWDAAPALFSYQELAECKTNERFI